MEIKEDTAIIKLYEEKINWIKRLKKDRKYSKLSCRLSTATYSNKESSCPES